MLLRNRMGCGLGFLFGKRPPWVPGPPPPPPPPPPDPDPDPVYADADLESARVFQAFVASFEQGGDAAQELFEAFPAIQTELGVPVELADLGPLTPASEHPNWNTNDYIRPPSSGATVEGIDLPGYIYTGSITGQITVRYVNFRAPVSGAKSYSVNRGVGGPIDFIIEDCRAKDFRSAFNSSNGAMTIRRVFVTEGGADAFKAGGGGPVRIENFWGEKLGQGVGSHADGIQISVGRDIDINRGMIWSVPDGPYSTGDLGGYNTGIYIHGTLGDKHCEDIVCAGVVFAWGGYYRIHVFPQHTDSVVRNILVAHNVCAPLAFKGSSYKSTGETGQVHPGMSDQSSGGQGLIENVVFWKNHIPGYGPVVYSHLGGPFGDIDGIWHWNPATLSDKLRVLLQDIGLLDANGDPVPGAVRSLAGAITTQTRSVPSTGGVALNLDLSSIPSDATNITVHVPSGSPIVLEYTDQTA